MERILVDKDSLSKKINKICGNGSVELCIVPTQSDCGIENPAFLHIGFLHDDGTYEDLESIDAVSYKRELKVMKTA